MPNQTPIVERAFQLARAGKVFTMVELRAILKKEGYTYGQIDHQPALSKQLRAIMEAARPKPPGRQQRLPD